MATQCMNDDDDEEHGRGARCDRLDESEGESDLDGVVDGIRRLVAQEQSNIPGDLLTASVTKWLDTVYDRMRRAHGERDGDEEEDAVEVLSMLLSACVSSQWRRYIGIKDDPIGDFVFHMNNLTMLFDVLATFVSRAADDMDTRQDKLLDTCDVIYTLGRLAQREPEVDFLLAAWRESPALFSRLIEQLPQGSKTQALSRHQQLTICYARFIGDAVHGSNARPPPPLSLRHLVGNDISLWRNRNWESKWQVFANPTLVTRTFGPALGCVAMVTRILRGFSIPQVNADSIDPSFDLRAFLFSLDLEQLAGLRHKVDVTLVKDGCLHPKWELNDTVEFEDIMDAFRSKYTIGIRGVHARSLVIADVCDALQQELKQHVNANIYWTPPGEQGFSLHVDDHCGKLHVASFRVAVIDTRFLALVLVFVIQLKGKKTWHVKEHIGVLPMLYSDLREPESAGLADEITLEPGKILYIPRGTPHCADTKGLSEDSIHLTIGVEIEPQFTKQELLLHVLSQELRGHSHDEVSDATGVVESIKCAMESDARRNQMRGGLMSWHLATDEAFGVEIKALLGDLKSILTHGDEDSKAAHQKDYLEPSGLATVLVQKTLDAFSVDDGGKIASLRQKVLADRNSFLGCREKASTLFALLHDSLHGSTRRASGIQDDQHDCQAKKRMKRSNRSMHTEQRHMGTSSVTE